LITGGCGFLGSNLAAALSARGDAIVVVDNLSRRGAESNLRWLREKGPITFELADVRDAARVQELVGAYRPEGILHLAGQVAMTTSIADPRLDFETNVGGTFNVLEAARLHSPDAILVYSSTNKVYGDLEQYTYHETATRYTCPSHPNGFDETVPLDFHSPYGCSKGAGDQYMLDYARMFGLRTVVFRHSSMYGGRQFATADQGWIGWFCAEALRIKHGIGAPVIEIAGNGKQVRDLLHVDDMLSLYQAALRPDLELRGEAFNVGGGAERSLSLLELFVLLEDLLGVHVQVTHHASRISDQRIFVADLSKATRLLGWRPLVGAREGIARMLDWTREAHGIGQGRA
jgi:CDP-paratose 2-epimerase